MKIVRRQGINTIGRKRLRPGFYHALLMMPGLLFLALFFLLPLLDNGVRSFVAEDGGITLERYRQLLTDPFYLKVLFETFALSVGVTFISLILGYPVAFFLVRHAGRFRGLIIFLLITPLLTSIIMRTYGWIVLFSRRGLVNELLVEQLGWLESPLRWMNTPGLAVAGLVHSLIPFMVLSIAAVLQGLDQRLEESAEILGASRLQTFRRIIWPMSLEGVGTGSLLVFMVANGSFVTVLLLGGGLQPLPLLIYQQFNTTRDFGMASAMGNVLLVIALVCLYVQLRHIRRRGEAA